MRVRPQKIPLVINKAKEVDDTITRLAPKTRVVPISTPKNISNEILWKKLPSNNYFQQAFPKEMIVLHFTSGHKWEHAYDEFLTAPQKLGYRKATPFIVDKKGPKYFIQLFDGKHWAYHLAIQKAEHNPNRMNEKRSIAIEIINIGPVWLKNEEWRDWTDRVWPTSEIVVGKNRDADGGVKFPKEQVDAVCRLINCLCDEWQIPRRVPKDKMSFQLPAINQFKGIVTHQMFREHGKYDMGPAWPWKKVIENCRLEEVNL